MIPKNRRLQIFKKIILKVFFLLIWSLILTIILKVFCFDFFKISSGSMEPTLMSGDRVMINKLIPGPRIFKDWKFWKNGNWELKRIEGLRHIKRNEVLVFNLPSTDNDWSVIKMDFNNNMVKRCIGIPGDTFYIENGFYKVRGCLDTLGIYNNQLDLSTRNDLVLESALKCFPFDSIHGWNLKNFGPFYIPKTNDTLMININNINLYIKLISYETKKSVEIKQGRVWLSGMIINKYIFKQNYYFMTGDNVFNSYDSRYWGLLPEDHIIGKVAFIWKSEEKCSRKVRRKRF